MRGSGGARREGGRRERRGTGGNQGKRFVQKGLRHSHPTAALHEFWQRRTQAEQPPHTEPGFVSRYSISRHPSRPPSYRNANLPSKRRKTKAARPLGSLAGVFFSLPPRNLPYTLARSWLVLIAFHYLPFHAHILCCLLTCNSVSLPCFRSFCNDVDFFNLVSVISLDPLPRSVKLFRFLQVSWP